MFGFQEFVLLIYALGFPVLSGKMYLNNKQKQSPAERHVLYNTMKLNICTVVDFKAVCLLLYPTIRV